MGRTTILSLLFLALSLGALGLWWSSGHSGTEAGDSAIAEGGSSPADEGAPSETRPHAAARDAVHAPSGSVTAPRAATAADAVQRREVRVVVRDRETKSPVPGATARIVRSSPNDLDRARQAEWYAWEGDPEAQAERIGASAVCDSDGVAVLPVTLGSSRAEGTAFVVTARSEGRYASSHVTLPLAGSDSVEVLLVKDTTLVVRVLDTAGQPLAGIAVGLLRQGRNEGGRPTTIACWRSDASGLARLVHLQDHGFTGPVVARAASPGVTSTTAAADCKSPPKDPIDITVQATGSLVVHVAGKPWGDLWTTLRVGEKGLPANREPVDPDSRSARYPRLGLGLVLLLRIERRSGLVLVEREVQGPRAGGEEVAVEIDPQSVLPRLVALVCDDQERPLVEKKLVCEILSERGGSETVRTESDAAGKVCVVLPHAMTGQPVRWMRFRLDDPTRVLRALVPTPFTHAAGEMNLGRLRLLEAPLIAGGAVVDEDGDGVPGAKLDILAARGGPGRMGKPMDFDGMFGQRQGLGPPDHDVTTVQHADGRFEIRGSAPNDLLHLAVKHVDFVRVPPLPFQAGQSDLRVVLARGAEVRATVLLDDPRAVTALGVALRPEADPKAQELRASVRKGEPGTAEARCGWSRVPAGRYALSVRSSRGEQLFTLPGIEVGGAGKAFDPRLACIDLRGIALCYTCRITDAKGNKLDQGGTLAPQAAGGVTPRNTQIWLEGGEAFWVTLLPSVDAVVRVSGCRARSVRLVPGANTVPLSAGLEVLVHCPELAGLSSQHVEVVLVPAKRPEGAQMDWNTTSRGRASKGASEIRCVVGEPGSWTLRVEAWDPRGRSMSLGFEPAILEVKDAAELQELTLALDADSKRRLEQWDKK